MKCRDRDRPALCDAIVYVESRGRWGFRLRCVLRENHCGECSAKWDDIGKSRASPHENCRSDDDSDLSFDKAHDARVLRGVFGEIADARRRAMDEILPRAWGNDGHRSWP